jgi:hypothetical protein
MKNSILPAAMVILIGLIGYTVAETAKVSRMGQQVILNTGGSSTTSGHTAMVTYDSPTNEYSFETITATVSGAATASTNTFSTAYLATPVIVSAYKSGSTAKAAGLTDVVTPTITTTSLIVSGMNSAGSTNNLTFVIYGYKRAGVFE